MLSLALFYVLQDRKLQGTAFLNVSFPLEENLLQNCGLQCYRKVVIIKDEMRYDMGDPVFDLNVKDAMKGS